MLSSDFLFMFCVCVHGFAELDLGMGHIASKTKYFFMFVNV